MLHELIAGMTKAAVFLAIAIAIEHVAPINRYSLKDRVPGLLMDTLGTFLAISLMWPLNSLWKHVAPFAVIPLWHWLKPLGFTGYALQFLVLIVVADFLAYWRHRMEHSRWWWPVHKVHHAPTELHAANDLGHPLQAIFTFIYITVPMSLFQLDGPEMPLILAMLVSFLSVYIHSPIDFHFGPLRRMIVDNRFHRIHHSLEPKHIDKNFGICLSVWDAMFGTAYWPEKNEWPAVGVRDVPAPKTVRDFLMLPLWGTRLVRMPGRKVGGQSPLPR